MRDAPALQGCGACQVSRRMAQRERCRQTNSITPQTTQAGMASSLKKLGLNRMGIGSGKKCQMEVNKA